MMVLRSKRTPPGAVALTRTLEQLASEELKRRREALEKRIRELQAFRSALFPRRQA